MPQHAESLKIVVNPQNMPKSAPGHPGAQKGIWWPFRHLEMVRNLMGQILEKFGGLAGVPKCSKTSGFLHFRSKNVAFPPYCRHF